MTVLWFGFSGLGSVVWVKENRQRQVQEQPQVPSTGSGQVLRLRGSQSALSHFALDDKLFGFAYLGLRRSELFGSFRRNRDPSYFDLL